MSALQPPDQVGVSDFPFVPAPPSWLNSTKPLHLLDFTAEDG